MKKVKLYAGLVIGICGFLYLIFSIGAGSFNSVNWSEGYRVGFIACSIGTMLLSVPAADLTKLD